MILALAALCGCSTPVQLGSRARRPFDFQRDTFAYANELVWEYHFDDHGKWVSQPRQPKPDYTHHCFVVARSARQFFEYAHFDPALPAVDETEYRRQVRKVLSTSTSKEMKEKEKYVIPGYASLHEFSQAHEALLKDECGGAWHSYVQRGHWRSILPFSRGHQEKMALRLVNELKDNHAPVVHLVRFPSLLINHAVVLFSASETENQIVFTAYDPNQPLQPTELTYDRATRTFTFPANDYFCGGRVDAYEVYYGWFH